MIKLIKSFPYDNSYEYIKTFSDKGARNAYFNSLSSIVIEDENYVRDNESFNVEYDYDHLVEEGVNYVIFNNGMRDVYAFIIKKDYIADNLTSVTFQVDVIQTYMFNYSLKKSFVERKKCTLNEILDYDEGIEIGEHIIESDVIVFEKGYTFFAMFSGFRENHILEKDGTISNIISYPMINVSRPITKIEGIDYPLSFMPLDDEFHFENFKNYLLDAPNLVGIVRVPNCSYTTVQVTVPVIKKENGKLINSDLGTVIATHITSIKSNGAVAISKSDITDFYPYTYYILTDGECEPFIMKPQYLNGTVDIVGKYAISHQPIERYYPEYYKGSNNGKVYNITNGSTMMLPTGSNGGIETLTANMSSIEQSKKSMYSNVLMSAIQTGVGVATGGTLGAVVGANAITSTIGNINSIKENIARNKDLELTPSSISSYGTPSTRNSFGTNNVRVVKYTIEQKYKDRLKNYTERYGNKYNDYAIIDHKSYKGYVKINGVNIDSGIDNMFLSQIIQIYEGGVFIE